MTQHITRRAVTKGAAWAVPAVAVTASAPAFAASCPADRDKVVNAYFDAYTATLPDLSRIKLDIWYGSEAGDINGALGTGAVNIRNTGTGYDFTKTPLLFEFGVRQVATSPAVNSIPETTVRYSPLTIPVTLNKPWDARGGNQSSGNNAVFVDSCERRRDFNFSTSFGDVYNPATGKQIIGALGPRSGHAETSGTCQGTYYNWNFALGTNLSVNSVVQMIAIEWRDGAAPGGRIYTTWGVRPIGFAPPVYEDFRTATKGNYKQFTGPTANADFDTCFKKAFDDRTATWVKNNEGARGMDVGFYGWAQGWMDQRKVMPTGSPVVWANEIGNYELARLDETQTPMLSNGNGKRLGTRFFQWTEAELPAYALKARDGIA